MPAALTVCPRGHFSASLAERVSCGRSNNLCFFVPDAFIYRPSTSGNRSRCKMRENQNSIRLNDRPLPKGHDEELLRLWHRLEVYDDPEQLMQALPAELFDCFRGNSLVLAFRGGSEVTAWLAIDSKRNAIEPTPK